MIITCPSCSSRYPVDEASFAPSGRKVRCAKCGHTWHQAPPTDLPRKGDEAVEATPAVAAEETPSPNARYVAPQKPLFRSDAVPRPAVEAVAGEPSAGQPASPEGQLEPVIYAEPLEGGGGTGGRLRAYLDEVASTRRGRVLTVIGWAALVLFVAGTIYGVASYRTEIASFWPSTARLYAAAGAPVNLRGLEFRNIAYERQNENGLPVLAVKGAVVNVSDEARPLPRLRVGLRDTQQRELYHWTFALPEKELGPKQTASFTTRLSSPPVDARDLEVRFVQKGEDIEPPAQGAASALPVVPAH